MQQQYTSRIDNDVVVPIALETSPDSKAITKIFQSWVDWIVESQKVDLPIEEIHEGLQCNCMINQRKEGASLSLPFLRGDLAQ
ncbi:hypothetical protein VKS41_005319 [Umbelopsis sp. WA50703]